MKTMNLKKVKTPYIFVIVLWFSSLISSQVSAQCSDAGVCAIGYTLATQQKQHTFEVLYRYGNSGKEDKIAYNSIELKASVKLFSQTSLRISAPLYRFNNGPGGEVNGIGDLMGFVDQDFSDVFGHDLSFLLGMRFATGDDNADPELPQAYQPGLGTNDFIFGLKISGKDYLLSVGYQLVEDTFTKNALTPIQRGDDFYLQFAYTFSLSDWTIRSDAQLIQRLSRTELKNADGSISTMDKTDQMQINLGAEIDYLINDMHHLVGGLAIPVLKRETNIDGLTRVFTFFAGWRLDL